MSLDRHSWLARQASYSPQQFWATHELQASVALRLHAGPESSDPPDDPDDPPPALDDPPAPLALASLGSSCAASIPKTELQPRAEKRARTSAGIATTFT